MNKQEILTRAIAQAERGGFDPFDFFGYEATAECYAREMLTDKMYEYDAYAYKLLLTDHAFARALWGEEPREHRIVDYNDEEGEILYIQSAWAYHLQEMVVSEDWLEYVAGTLQ